MSKKHPNPLNSKKYREAIAKLIQNTRRGKRSSSLVEIAKWLDIAVEGFGTLTEVAERIDLSSKMLRQFTAINGLSKKVKAYFADRKIDSVDIAVHLLKFSKSDQNIITKEIVKSELNSADVRAIWEFKKDFPKSKICEAIERVKNSRNVKHYVIEFVIRSAKTKSSYLSKRFGEVIGVENLTSIEKEGSIGRIKMNKLGKEKMSQFAKINMLTKEELVYAIVQGEV